MFKKPGVAYLPDVACRDWVVKVVSSLCGFVHVTPERFAIDVIGVLVLIPVDRVVWVGHAVRGDVTLPVALAPSHQARNRRGRPKVELQPFAVCKIEQESLNKNCKIKHFLNLKHKKSGDGRDARKLEKSWTLESQVLYFGCMTFNKMECDFWPRSHLSFQLSSIL